MSFIFKITLFIFTVTVNIAVYRSLKILRTDKYVYLKDKMKKIYWISGILLMIFDSKIVQFYSTREDFILMMLSGTILFFFFVKAALHFILGHHWHKYREADASYNSVVSDKFVGF